MKRFALLCMIGLMAASLVAPASTQAAPRGAVTNGRILFTHCEDGSGCQIYTANPNGSAIEQVTSGGDSMQGDWSPNAKRIAYVSFASGDAAIWVVGADGSNPTQLTPDDPNSDDFWPRFTPDGDWILFTNCAGSDCDGGIFAVHPNGSQMHPITPNSHDSYNIADMSPDGTRLAYMRWHVGGVKMAVYVSRADGTGQRRVTPPRLQGWWPDWAPDATRIVFTDEVFWDRPAPSLWTVRPDGGGLRPLTEPPYLHSDYRAAYAPNGRTVIFESDRRYDDFCCSDLFTVPAGGGDVHRVRLPFDAYEVQWGTAPTMSSPVIDTRPMRSTGEGGSPCDRIDALSGLAPCAGAEG